jgi:hypothetical protein
MNLPPGWEEAPEDMAYVVSYLASSLPADALHRFLYALFVAIDANFRLKRKDVSTEEKDPGLGPGWAFFCEVKTYMAHVKKHWDQPQDVSEIRATIYFANIFFGRGAIV